VDYECGHTGMSTFLFVSYRMYECFLSNTDKVEGIFMSWSG